MDFLPLRYDIINSLILFTQFDERPFLRHPKDEFNLIFDYRTGVVSNIVYSESTLKDGDYKIDDNYDLIITIPFLDQEFYLQQKKKKFQTKFDLSSIFGIISGIIQVGEPEFISGIDHDSSVLGFNFNIINNLFLNLSYYQIQRNNYFIFDLDLSFQNVQLVPKTKFYKIVKEEVYSIDTIHKVTKNIYFNYSYRPRNKIELSDTNLEGFTN